MVLLLYHYYHGRYHSQYGTLKGLFTFDRFLFISGDVTAGEGRTGSYRKRHSAISGLAASVIRQFLHFQSDKQNILTRPRYEQCISYLFLFCPFRSQLPYLDPFSVSIFPWLFDHLTPCSFPASSNSPARLRKAWRGCG